MPLVPLGDLAQSYLLRRQSTGVKADIQRLSTELTTGRVTDTAARVAGRANTIEHHRVAFECKTARFGNLVLAFFNFSV